MAGQTRNTASIGAKGLGLIGAGAAFKTTANLGMFKVQLQNASNSNQDIRAEDDAAFETLEMVLGAINPLAYSVANDNTGIIHFVVDGSQWDQASLQIAIRNLGTAVGPNDIDVSGSDVTAATTFVVA